MGFNSGFKGLNGLVHFAERRNLVSARVPSHFQTRSTMNSNITLDLGNKAVCYPLAYIR